MYVRTYVRTYVCQCTLNSLCCEALMHMATTTCVIHFVACESRVFVGGWKTRKLNKTNFEGRKRGRGEGENARPFTIFCIFHVDSTNSNGIFEYLCRAAL